MPSGRVKWYDAEKGFGFVSQERGEDVFVPKSALPTGVAELKKGQKVEFGIADGRRGPQALSLQILDPVHSVSAATRKSPDDLTPIVEDLIKLLDGVSNQLRRGRFPERAAAKKVGSVLRAVADDLEA